MIRFLTHILNPKRQVNFAKSPTLSEYIFTNQYTRPKYKLTANISTSEQLTFWFDIGQFHLKAIHTK